MQLYILQNWSRSECYRNAEINIIFHVSHVFQAHLNTTHLPLELLCCKTFAFYQENKNIFMSELKMFSARAELKAEHFTFILYTSDCRKLL